jgi:hypothetical protein
MVEEAKPLVAEGRGRWPEQFEVGEVPRWPTMLDEGDRGGI